LAGSGAALGAFVNRTIASTAFSNVPATAPGRRRYSEGSGKAAN